MYINLKSCSTYWPHLSLESAGDFRSPRHLVSAPFGKFLDTSLRNPSSVKFSVRLCSDIIARDIDLLSYTSSTWLRVPPVLDQALRLEVIFTQRHQHYYSFRATNFIDLVNRCDEKNNRALTRYIYRVAQKSKPLPNDHKIVLNRIKAYQRIRFIRQIKVSI